MVESRFSTWEPTGFSYEKFVKFEVSYSPSNFE